ncbi:uncharacterized protein LOC141802546 [Halichoeres trimaculatus]|uniref:uncharacterized protein LOC141802546 n=1 Tax=Halichoeres trimaculatus TaxID=147232 RepID=UPI003D9F6967
MSKVQTVRGLIIQRLSAAAEEIFELFERTIAEYEEQLCRSKEENQRQQKLLEAVYNPEVRLHRADVQQLLVSPENVPCEQKERGLSLDQEDPGKPAHIKEEQEELWSHQEKEQLHGLKEETTEFLLTPVPAKTTEEEGEEPEFSQLHEKQTEEMLPSESDTDDSSYYLEESSKPHSGLNHVSDMECNTVETPLSFSDCATSSDPTEPEELQKLNETQKEKKPFCCSSCDKRFDTKAHLTRHMSCHSSEKPFCCSVCGKKFSHKTYLARHIKFHSGEKPYICSICGKGLTTKASLKRHMVCHSGEKPFTCSVCGRSFALQKNLKAHSFVHSGEKPHSCSQCGKRYLTPLRLKEHTAAHAGEKLYSCLLCNSRFSSKSVLSRHVNTHTGKKPYSCSVCEKTFTRSDSLKNHSCKAESS